jgi:hypothetical protein
MHAPYYVTLAYTCACMTSTLTTIELLASTSASTAKLVEVEASTSTLNRRDNSLFQTLKIHAHAV